MRQIRVIRVVSSYLRYVRSCSRAAVKRHPERPQLCDTRSSDP